MIFRHYSTKTNVEILSKIFILIDITNLNKPIKFLFKMWFKIL